MECTSKLPENFCGYSPVTTRSDRQIDITGQLSCRRLETSSETILVCERQESWIEKVAPAAPSLLISLLAIFISLRSLGYTQTKDVRARKQSIVDDFWLRKILSPSTLEPLILLLREISEKSVQSVNVEIFRNFEQRTRALMSAFDCFTFLGDSVYKEVQEQLEKLEDALAIFGSYIATEADPQIISGHAKELQNTTAAVLFDIMNAIRKHQESV